MGESSKFPKSWTLENQNLKLAVCLQIIKKSKLNGQIPETKSEKLLLPAEFSILRLNFYGESASKSWIQE